MPCESIRDSVPAFLIPCRSVGVLRHDRAAGMGTAPGRRPLGTSMAQTELTPSGVSTQDFGARKLLFRPLACRPPRYIGSGSHEAPAIDAPVEYVLLCAKQLQLCRSTLPKTSGSTTLAQIAVADLRYLAVMHSDFVQNTYRFAVAGAPQLLKIAQRQVRH